MVEQVYFLFMVLIAACMMSTAAMQLILAWIIIRGNVSQKPANLCEIEKAPEGPSKAMRSKLMQPADLISTSSFKDTPPVQGFGDQK